ncbi:MAG: hypothetical protein KUG75_15450 [Pseudomonadales bacterium]|nr:hypothetical protein [Pseudomonadales bacterium]
MSKKTFLSSRELLEESFRLGTKIVESGFRPDFLVAIWRGGVPIGIAVQECLQYFGVETDHIAIRTASYGNTNKRGNHVKIFGLSYLVENINHEDSLLIVDDVFDTGLTVDAVINELALRSRANMPHDLRIAVPWFKPLRNKTDRVPDYYIHETDDWLVYPHSLEGLTEDEIAEYRPDLHKIIEGAKAG